ncbi:hypothetical protein B566_EDAN012834 [Ephemera danica]|nr:hypothetical protein B566_EDAN012834 [Ephemera danica]
MTYGNVLSRKDKMDFLDSSTPGSQSSYDTSESPMSMASMGSPQEFENLNFSNTICNESLSSNFNELALHAGDMVLTQAYSPQPYLVITEQPQDKFRFRYVSEMHGTHGCIMGINKSRVHKTYPTVELKNWNTEATIRCSLSSIDFNHRVAHPHILVAKIGAQEKPEPHDIVVPNKNGFKAEFQSIGIIHTARKNVEDALVEKRTKRMMEELGNNTKLTQIQQSQIQERAHEDATKINLNSVCLCFEALVRDEKGAIHPICPPVYSDPIHNMKSALTGELKICRIDKVSGSCKGGDEVFIFVEKVNKKNVKIRFYEMDEDGQEVWEDYGRFNELDVHHQYAIAFRTPPYRHTRLSGNIEVLVELQRPSDGLRSTSKKFTYKPQECDMYGPNRKRAREEVSAVMATNASIVPTSELVPPMPLLEDHSLDTLMEHYPSHTTPSFEQFLFRMQEVPENLTDYLQLLEEDGTVARGGPIPGNPNVVADVAPQEDLKAEAPMMNNDVQEGQQDNMDDLTACDLRADLAPKVVRAMQKAQESELNSSDTSKVLLQMSLSQGTSAIHTAVENDQQQELQAILDYNTVLLPEDKARDLLNLKNSTGQTALYISVLCNRVKMVSILLNAGANMKMECHNKSSLSLAIELGFNECLEVLLNHIKDTQNMDIDEKNSVGGKGSVEMGKMLLDAGADPALCNNDPIEENVFTVQRLMNAETGVGEKKYFPSDMKTKCKTAFDLVCSPEVDAVFQQWKQENCKTEGKSENLTEDGKETEVDHDTVKVEDWSSDLEDAFDQQTLTAIIKLLHKDEAWKKLAQCMGLESIIPDLEGISSPAENLLKDHMSEVSVGELRDLLDALDFIEGVECIDEMLAQRLSEHEDA